MAMMDVIVEIMFEILTIPPIATKEVKRGPFSELMSRIILFVPFLLRGYSEKYLKKLTGERDIEDSLERLDELTQEEVRMASVELLKMTNSDGKVMGVDDRVKVVEGPRKVQDARATCRMLVAMCIMLTS
jgi:hypothetical protein